MKYIWD